MEGPPLAWGLENPRPLRVWSLANQFGIAKCSSDYCPESQVRIFQPWQEEQGASDWRNFLFTVGVRDGLRGILWLMWALTSPTLPSG